MEKNSLFVLIALLALTCCKKKVISEGNIPDPPYSTDPSFDFSKEGLTPEGIAYDGKSRNFLVSSISTGIVGKVSLQGNYTPFLNNANVISSLGIKVDSGRNRILVAIGDLKSAPSTATRDNIAALGIYNQTTGVQEKYIDLGILKKNSKHLANDIAVDKEGNVYITDSFSPIIYKVDINGNASIFIENAAFNPLKVGDMAGLNGILFHPDGYLVVAKMDEGILFKIPLSDPAKFTKISSVSLPGDGILLTHNNKIVVMTPTLNTAYLVSSTNAWSTATVEKTFATGNVWPTTLTYKEHVIFALYTYDIGTAPANKFTIKSLPF